LHVLLWWCPTQSLFLAIYHLKFKESNENSKISRYSFNIRCARKVILLTVSTAYLQVEVRLVAALAGGLQYLDSEKFSAIDISDLEDVSATYSTIPPF
jgi:hypothetical protein